MTTILNEICTRRYELTPDSQQHRDRDGSIVSVPKRRQPVPPVSSEKVAYHMKFFSDISKYGRRKSGQVHPFRDLVGF